MHSANHLHLPYHSIQFIPVTREVPKTSQSHSSYVRMSRASVDEQQGGLDAQLPDDSLAEVTGPLGNVRFG